jgi:hypothetical protein
LSNRSIGKSRDSCHFETQNVGGAVILQEPKCPTRGGDAIAKSQRSRRFETQNVGLSVILRRQKSIKIASQDARRHPAASKTPIFGN